MSKTTPGPWRTGEKVPQAVYAGEDIICLCDSMSELSHGEEAANARLIAAAPELLEALQAILPIAEEYRKGGEYSGSADIRDWPEITCARAAIAKATGRAA